MKNILLGLVISFTGIACSHVDSTVFWLHKSQVVGDAQPDLALLKKAHDDCLDAVKEVKIDKPEVKDLLFVMCMREQDFALVEHIDFSKK